MNLPDVDGDESISISMMYDSRLTSSPAATPARGKALRAFGWHELTARINAARDLRRELMQDSSMMAASFGDAAAGYFAGESECKLGVNPNALGASKACGDKERIDISEMGASEARDIND